MGRRIAVLGAGSWGTALALLLAKNGHAVTLWGHRPEGMRRLATERCNRRYLPNAPFPPELEVTDHLAEAVPDREIVLVAVPSHAFRDLLPRIAPLLTPGAGLAWATKGLEVQTGRLLHEIAEDILGREIATAVLSGPTFAGEVAAGLPTAITVASRTHSFAADMASSLHNLHFRAYTTDDMVGVQLGGATKNVLAIAAGVADGLGFGANSRAALITRGLAEMMRLGLALGGKAETFMGLAGVGDLILTCTDDQSRNRRFGLGLGKGLSRDAAARQIGQEIEGVATAEVIHRLSRRYRVDMPISDQVYRILYEGLAPSSAVHNLLIREPKSEGMGN
jgi:glycerol-3-phosphate dehydrogenase (NAD(P)+)